MLVPQLLYFWCTQQELRLWRRAPVNSGCLLFSLPIFLSLVLCPRANHSLPLTPPPSTPVVIQDKKTADEQLCSSAVFGALNRSCRLSAAHGKQRVSAVLSAIDFADFPPLNSCIFVYKKYSTDKSLCLFLVHSTGVEPAWIAPQDP